MERWRGEVIGGRRPSTDGARPSATGTRETAMSHVHLRCGSVGVVALDRRGEKWPEMPIQK
jgi:hypothetical protein